MSFNVNAKSTCNVRPDISGYADFRPFNEEGNLATFVSGAIYAEKVPPKENTYGVTPNHVYGTKMSRISIKSSLSSALYKGDTFQTKALRLLAIVKF